MLLVTSVFYLPELGRVLSLPCIKLDQRSAGASRVSSSYRKFHRIVFMKRAEIHQICPSKAWGTAGIYSDGLLLFSVWSMLVPNRVRNILNIPSDSRAASP